MVFIGEEITETTYYNITDTVVQTTMIALAPLFIMLIILTIVANVSQFGFLLNPLKIDFAKINPMSGLKSIFGLKKLLEALKTVGKIKCYCCSYGDFIYAHG